MTMTMIKKKTTVMMGVRRIDIPVLSSVVAAVVVMFLPGAESSFWFKLVSIFGSLSVPVMLPCLSAAFLT